MRTKTRTKRTMSGTIENNENNGNKGWNNRKYIWNNENKDRNKENNGWNNRTIGGTLENNG